MTPLYTRVSEPPFSTGEKRPVLACRGVPLSPVFKTQKPIIFLQNRKEIFMKNRERKVNLHIFLSEDESKLLDEKFKLSGRSSKSAFIRQLITRGFVFDIDFSEIQRYNYLLSNIANNVNQVAHRCNETRSVYRSDIEELKKEIDKIWQLQKSMLSMLPSEGQ